MYNKNDPSQFPSYLRPNIIKSENEIYMIKDNNKNKINEILKTIHSAKNIKKIGIDEDVKENNESIINSITTTRDLFRKYFNIKETKKKYDDKLEKKYQSFHKYLKKRNREDYLQRGINMSYRKQYKIAEKTEQNKN